MTVAHDTYYYDTAEDEDWADDPEFCPPDSDDTDNDNDTF